MAEYGPQHSITLTAAVDLTAVQHHVMRHVGDGTTNIASHAAAAFAVGIAGVLQNKPNSGQHATVATFGKSKVVAGAATTQYGLLTTDGSGRGITAASGQLVFGRGMQAAANAGEVITVELFPPFRLSGAI